MIRILGIFGRVLLALLLLAMLAMALHVLGIVLWLILLFVIIEGMRKYRATQQYGLLWLLTVSAERRMPLAPAVEAFAQERWGRFRRKARRLAEKLNAGTPLPEALDQCPGLLPRYARPMIRVGYETGTLAESLRRAATVRNWGEPVWMALQGKLGYLLIAPLYATALLAFIMWKIIPSFEKIFRDFDMRLPELTASLINVWYWSLDYWYLLFPLYLLGPALMVYIPMRYFGWTEWDLPGMGRFTRRLDSAEILDSLALAARQERPIGEGVAALAGSYPKRRIRRRLRRAAEDIAAGHNWCDSLLRHGLIRRPEQAILQAAQRVGNLPWAMTEMAGSARRRLYYRAQAAAQLLFPPVVILMGLAVMFIVVALFLPLIALIQNLI